MTNQYLYTDDQVRTLVQERIEATVRVTHSRLTYLRVLVALTLKEMGLIPRLNATRNVKRLSPEMREAQLAALATVNAKLYAIVESVVEPTLADVPAKERALERNARTNFARTSFSLVNRFAKAGKDLSGLALARLTKASLRVELPPRPPSARRLRTRVEAQSKAFMAALLELAETDQQAAAAELDTLLGQMATQLAALGGKAAVRDPKRAAADHVPLQVGSQLFIPTATTILRQREKPS